MKTAKEECKSMPKRLKSVVDVGPFVVEQNAFKIKVLLLDPMVKKQKNKTYYCYSYYKDQRSDKTKLKAKNATAQWEKEKEKEEIKMRNCASSKYKFQQSDKTKLKAKSGTLQWDKENKENKMKAFPNSMKETVVDSPNSAAAADSETESESDFNLDADNESMDQQPALDSQVVTSMEQQQCTNIINKAREIQDHAARSRKGPAKASAATTKQTKK
jgi:hypothetical protein